MPVLIHFGDLVTNTPTDLFYRDNNAGSPNSNNDGLRDKLGRMAAAINNRAANNPLFRWSAQAAGTRLTILPTEMWMTTSFPCIQRHGIRSGEFPEQC